MKENMKNTFVKSTSSMRRGLVVGTIIEFIIGLVMIIDPASSSGALGYIVGACFFAYAVAVLIMFFVHPIISFFSLDVLSAVVAVILGIVIFSHPNSIMYALSIAIGIMLIFVGCMAVYLGIAFGLFGVRNWWLCIVASAVFVIAGIVIIFNLRSASSAIMVFTGLILLLEGCANIAAAVKLKSFAKDVDKTATEVENAVNEASDLSDDKQDAVEVDYKDVDNNSKSDDDKKE